MPDLTGTFSTICIRAHDVRDNKNGTFSITIPAKELSLDDQKALERLFPNLSEKAFKLLAQEALIQSIASESEIASPPVDKQAKKY